VCYVGTFVVGLVINVLIAYKSSRWRLLHSRLRHFRSLGDAVIGQLVSGLVSGCSGLAIVLAAVVTTSCQLTPEVLCRAGAALPQLVLTSATTVAVLFVFSYCDAVACCRRLKQIFLTARKVTPLVVGLTTAAIALRNPSSGNWLDSACATDKEATYRLPTALAAVCFIASTAGTILVLSNYLTLSRPERKMTEVLPVPLMELDATVEDRGGVGSHVISGDVAAAQQTCRISCEAAAQQETDDIGSWRCSSKMGLPSMTSLLRSKSSLKSSQKSVAVKVKPRRSDEEDQGQEDSCEVNWRTEDRIGKIC